MNRVPKPLYRKVNTRTWGVRHSVGEHYKYSRRKKKDTKEVLEGSMHGKKRHGLDHTPLYQFLISKVGETWDEVYSEAKSRLIRAEPIFHLVAASEEDRNEIVRVGESTYYSGLFVNESGALKKVNEGLQAKDMVPYCDCCTHTFNGIKFGEE